MAGYLDTLECSNKSTFEKKFRALWKKNSLQVSVKLVNINSCYIVSKTIRLRICTKLNNRLYTLEMNVKSEHPLLLKYFSLSPNCSIILAIIVPFLMRPCHKPLINYCSGALFSFFSSSKDRYLLSRGAKAWRVFRVIIIQVRRERATKRMKSLANRYSFSSTSGLVTSVLLKQN